VEEVHFSIGLFDYVPFREWQPARRGNKATRPLPILSSKAGT